MRKGKIDARVFLCFAFVYRLFEGWQDAMRMNMRFDGGRGDGEHWCSHAGILLGLQSAHMIILMWCLRFHLLLNWHSHRWHLYSLRIKTSLFQCYPCYSCQGKPVAEERGLLSKNGFSAFSWPHTWFPPPGLPNPNLDPRKWQQLNRISCGKSYFPLETILLPLSQLWCIVWQYPLFAAFVATCVSESFFLCLKYLRSAFNTTP